MMAVVSWAIELKYVQTFISLHGTAFTYGK